MTSVVQPQTPADNIDDCSDVAEQQQQKVAPGRSEKRGATTNRKRRQTRAVITPTVEAGVSSAMASGVPVRRIAKAYKMSPTTVQAIAKKPENAEFINTVRELIRTYHLSRIQASQESIYNWLDATIKFRDPKAFESLTRGLSSLEKISSSASGEARKVEGTINVKEATPNEAKELIEALLASAESK